MELKTKVNAVNGTQEIVITREFDLPVELLFKAYEDAELMAQWMDTKVVTLESRKNGCYLFEKYDPNGNLIFKANGVIHDFISNQKITRTFEMSNVSFGVQLEIYQFEKLTDSTSKLTMHVIYESVAQRDELLKLTFAQGLNWAHNRLQQVADQSK